MCKSGDCVLDQDMECLVDAEELRYYYLNCAFFSDCAIVCKKNFISNSANSLSTRRGKRAYSLASSKGGQPGPIVRMGPGYPPWS